MSQKVSYRLTKRLSVTYSPVSVPCCQWLMSQAISDLLFSIFPRLSATLLLSICLRLSVSSICPRLSVTYCPVPVPGGQWLTVQYLSQAVSDLLSSICPRRSVTYCPESVLGCQWLNICPRLSVTHCPVSVPGCQCLAVQNLGRAVSDLISVPGCQWLTVQYLSQAVSDLLSSICPSLSVTHCPVSVPGCQYLSVQNLGRAVSDLISVPGCQWLTVQYLSQALSDLLSSICPRLSVTYCPISVAAPPPLQSNPAPQGSHRDCHRKLQSPAMTGYLSQRGSRNERPAEEWNHWDRKLVEEKGNLKKKKHFDLQLEVCFWSNYQTKTFLFLASFYILIVDMNKHLLISINISHLFRVIIGNNSEIQ